MIIFFNIHAHNDWLEGVHGLSKLNRWTEKDHFPMPFIDQMLDRLADKSYYCFLDGCSGYNQITITLAPENQEKDHFLMPFLSCWRAL